MATQALPAAFIPDSAKAGKPRTRPSRLRRLMDFIIEAQTRRAQREVALYLAGRGNSLRAAGR